METTKSEYDALLPPLLLLHDASSEHAIFHLKVLVKKTKHLHGLAIWHAFTSSTSPSRVSFRACYSATLSRRCQSRNQSIFSGPVVPRSNKKLVVKDRLATFTHQVWTGEVKLIQLSTLKIRDTQRNEPSPPTERLRVLKSVTRNNYDAWTSYHNFKSCY